MSLIRKILYPVSVIYDKVTKTRNSLYDKRILNSYSFDIPIIVVGNLNVGGTGKTPQIEYLIRLLSNDYKVAVLSRGYKRKSKGFVLADEKATAISIGDEPYQYYKKFKNTIIAVDANRVNGINNLLNLANKPDIILLDDAFQHRKVDADFNILLTRYNDLYVDDKLLPTGNLRENVSGAERAQVIVVTKCPTILTEDEQFEITKKLNPSVYQTVFFSTITYDENLYGSNSELTINSLKDIEIVLVTGIANPSSLIQYLESHQLKIHHLKYPDHYSFTQKDIDSIKNTYNKILQEKKIILTTEKDYVRIFDRLNCSYIAIQTKLISHESDFNSLIKNYVEQSSRNS